MDVLGYGLARRALAGVRQLLGWVHKRSNSRIDFLHLLDNDIKKSLFPFFLESY